MTRIPLFVHRQNLPLMMGSFLFSTLVNATSPESLLEKSDTALQEAVAQCANQEVRLSRLACFDALFPPPSTLQNEKTYEIKPQAWQRAWDTEARRKDVDGFLINRLNPEADKDGVWLTMAAKNRRSKTAATLMLSCIDNITRVELVFLEPLQHAMAQISLSHHQDTLTSRWLSDESGLVFRTSRGLGAIDTVKFVMGASQLSLRSDVPEINGLVFETQGLKKQVQILRSACHW